MAFYFEGKEMYLISLCFPKVLLANSLQSSKALQECAQ